MVSCVSRTTVVFNCPYYILKLFPNKVQLSIYQLSILSTLTFISIFMYIFKTRSLKALKDDLEWKVIYVGSAESEKHDQELDSVLVGPVPIGVNKFVFQADAPDTAKIPAGNLLGCTVVLIICSYKEQEFIRVGYYVNNASDDFDPEHPDAVPEKVDISRVQRHILADKPRVTRFPIEWE